MSRRSAAAGLFQGFVHVDFTSLYCRDKPEKNSGKQRNPERECQDSPIKRDLTRTRNRRRTGVKNQFDCQARD